jgi:hypothetical protein
MPQVIARTPSVTVREDQATPVDLSCYVDAWRPNFSQSSIAVPSFCAPEATELGPATYSGELSVLWSDEAQAAFEPLLDAELSFVIKANEGDTKAHLFTGKIASFPMPDIVPGEVMRVTVPVAITSTPTYGTPPVANP